MALRIERRVRITLGGLADLNSEFRVEMAIASKEADGQVCAAGEQRQGQKVCQTCAADQVHRSNPFQHARADGLRGFGERQAVRDVCGGAANSAHCNLPDPVQHEIVQ